MRQRNGVHPGIWALAVTAFAISVTEFIVVGYDFCPGRAVDLLAGWHGTLFALRGVTEQGRFRLLRQPSPRDGGIDGRLSQP